MEQLYIRTLGELTLCAGERQISDSDSRSKKVWMLMAYLLCHRTRVIPGRELIKVLWGEEPASSNPENTLKITFHRARTQLNQLWPTAGHDLLLNREGGYCWNNEVPMRMDAEDFEQQCQRGSLSEEAWMERALSALKLYHGDFMPKLGAEIWLIPVSSHYHNLYIQTVLDLAPLLAARGRHQEVATICRKAIFEEPYHEPLYQRLMAALQELGDQAGIVSVYEDLSQRLMTDFGIYPSDETTAIYRAATNALSDHSLSLEAVQEHLRDDGPAGALECEYDYFRVLCRAESRAMLRSGRIAHIALFSISSKTGKPLSTRSHNRVMELYGEHIRSNLRRGDAYARCSASQYIVMLPEANYENSNMVCRRLIAAFQAKHPHSPAKINFMVQALTPNGITLRPQN